MSLLLLVRHGQASFLADDYDQLSEKGTQQAILLGKYWKERNFLPDHTIVGPCRRHKQTWQGILQGLELKEADVSTEFVDDWDEYHGIALMKAVLPQLLETDEELQAVAALHPESRGKMYQKLFEVVTGRWVRNELNAEGVEPWAAFRQRIRGGLQHIRTTAGRGKHVAVVSSAGPVAAVMGEILGLEEEQVLALSWQLFNASVSEFLFSSQKMSLSRFNTTPHFQDPAWVTYR